MVYVGEPGSGKSLAAIEFARTVDPSFENDPRVVYNTKDFIGALQKMKKGQAIVYDEIGLGAAARTFMSQANLMMSAVSQILRFKNILVIFTTPSISFFDKNVRMLLNAIVRMESIDYEHEVTYAKYNLIRNTSACTVVKVTLFFFVT
jgi:KaiC/GvpD/RAD55 family RecA-like ATPase